MSRPYTALVRIARKLESMFGGTVSNEPPLIRIAQALEGATISDGEIDALKDRVDALELRVDALEQRQCKVTVTAKIDTVATASIGVIGTDGTHTVMGATDENGKVEFYVGAGTWTFSGGFDPEVYENITDGEVELAVGDEKTCDVTCTTIVPPEPEP